MPQTATIKSLPAALQMMKAMQAEGLEWGEDCDGTKFEDVYGRWQESQPLTGCRDCGHERAGLAALAAFASTTRASRSRPSTLETALVADPAGAHRNILCIQERVVGNDNTGHCRDLRSRKARSGRTSSSCACPPRSRRHARGLPRSALAAVRSTMTSHWPARPLHLWTTSALPTSPTGSTTNSCQTVCRRHRST